MLRMKILAALACMPLLATSLGQGGSCGGGAGDAPANSVAGIDAKGHAAATNGNDSNSKVNMNDSNAASNRRTAEGERVPAGKWGGVHVRLEVRDDGADIEYDCAHGTITAPLELNGEGRFSVAGTHVRESPGPIRLGRTPPSLPARYTGKVSGGEMTLTVTLSDTSEEIGSFKLTRGSEGRIRKCR